MSCEAQYLITAKVSYVNHSHVIDLTSVILRRMRATAFYRAYVNLISQEGVEMARVRKAESDVPLVISPAMLRLPSAPVEALRRCIRWEARCKAERRRSRGRRREDTLHLMMRYGEA